MPTTIRTGRLAARARRAFYPALALACAAAIAACSSTEPSDAASAAPDGLVALVATADATSLVGWSGTATKAVPITLPKGDTTWIATGRADVLAAALANGTTATSDPIHLGKPLDWRAVKAKDASGDIPKGHQDYVSWDPEGGRFATLVGDLLSGDGISVMLIDPSAGSAFAIPIDRSVIAAPPVWIGADRLVVVTGDASSPLATIVDTETGELSDGPLGARLLATSADGRRVATMDEPGDPVIVRDTDAWLGGDHVIDRVSSPAERIVQRDRVLARRDRSATCDRLAGAGRHRHAERLRRPIRLAPRRETVDRRGKGLRRRVAALGHCAEDRGRAA